MALLNRHKLTSPDSALGKLLIAGRAEWQLLALRVSTRNRWDPVFAELARRLTPRHTMLSLVRLKKLYELGTEVGGCAIGGAVAECGVWNGGSSAMIAAGLARAADDASRPFWLFDSFEGLPAPTERDEAGVRARYFPGWCTGSVERVREAHQIVGHPLDDVHIVPGWFDDTLGRHAAAVGPIALLHIDADWYDSVMIVLTTLYAQVAPGGLVVIDDYGSWSGCRRAVHDYFGDAGMAALDVQAIDGHAVYFRKP